MIPSCLVVIGRAAGGRLEEFLDLLYDDSPFLSRDKLQALFDVYPVEVEEARREWNRSQRKKIDTLL